MQSPPVVYVSRISNLSDARYCAGMGVGLLGFVVNPASLEYVSPSAFQQIIGWVSGPKRVAELGPQLPPDLEQIRNDYAADYFHIAIGQLTAARLLSVPLLVEIHFDEYASYHQAGTLPTDGIAYWIVTGVPDAVNPLIFSNAPVLIARSTFPGLTTDFLSMSGAAGVALQGSHESSPGLKEYDHLSKILEELNG